MPGTELGSGRESDRETDRVPVLTENCLVEKLSKHTQGDKHPNDMNRVGLTR